MLFVFLSLFSGLMVISAPSPVQSLLWLVLAFLSAAGWFFLLELPFLGLLVVVVYVGALATLFLFVVMMLHLSVSGSQEDATHFLPAGLVVASSFSACFVNLRSLGSPGLPKSSNLEVFGSLLYTDYFLLLLLASFVLLVAMVGAVLLAGSRTPPSLKDEVSFLPILLLSFVLAAGLLGASAAVGLREFNREKLSSYECGFDPFESARVPFSVRFFLVGLLFLIFDLELSFLFPWSVVFGQLGLLGLGAILCFLAVLTVGLVFEWCAGGLE